MADSDRTASLMTPSKLAHMKPRGAASPSPSAWLNQMAADAGHAHVHRLGELHGILQAQALLRDVAPIKSELTRLAEALPRLDFGLLRSHGWWARTTGRSRSAGTEFAAQFNQIDQVVRGLVAHTQALRAKQKEQAAVNDRALVEVEVEYHAIEKIIDEGARWLHDMRGQIKSRQAVASDPAALGQIRDDTARCEILVERLKTLRAVVSAARHSHREARGAAARREALLHLLQHRLASEVKAWQARLSAAVATTGEGGSPPRLEAPMEAHRELQLCVKGAVADCRQLRKQEKTLAESLAALGTQLQAA